MEYIKSAFTNIRQNKGRTFLTMLGIIIGISSVITILSIGNGMKSELNTSLDSIAGGAVTIQLDAKKTSKYLTSDDLQLIRDAVPEAAGVTPSLTLYATSDMRNRETADIRLFGGNADYIHEFDNGIYEGRFYNDDDVASASEVCVLTQQSAIYLFGSTEVTGMILTADAASTSHDLTVIGVMRSTEEEVSYARSIMASGELRYVWADVYIPYTVITQRYGQPGENITSFSVYPISGKADEAAVKAKSVTENILDLRGEGAVKIQSFASMMDMYTNILSAVTMVIALVAAISLVVGGIGVMNIMTVTVTERTREIGIRKSLGARTSYILLQFLTESATISLIGGLIGMLIGFLLSRVVGNIIGITAVMLPRDVLLTVSISVAVGLFFGIYPARRAARLNPIDALRTE